MRDLYVFRGIAPVEINIPKEFLFSDIPLIKPVCTCIPVGFSNLVINPLLSSTSSEADLDFANTLKVLTDSFEANYFCEIHRPTLIKNVTTSNVKTEYPGQLELVQEATRAFKQTGYSYYDQYYFYRERLGVRSLFELYEYDLKKLLLLLG